MIRTVALGGLLLAALALPAGAAEQEGEKKDRDKGKTKRPLYKTPQECFDAYAAAESKGDARAYIDCFAPQSQKRMAAEHAVRGVATRAEFKDPKGKDAQERAKMLRPLFDVLDKHGLTEKATKDIKESEDPKEKRKAEEAALALIKDPAAFAADTLAAFYKMFGGAEKGEEKKDGPKPKLTEVKIEGDKATATIVTTSNRRDRKKPISFVKVGGGWLVLDDEVPPKKKGKDSKEGDKD